MRRFFRVTVILCLGVLALAVLGTGGGYLWLRTSLPTTEGTLVLSGPGAPVEIVRDSRGIPFIRAETQADAYFALGFVHAQDRMWQMEMTRRLGTGRTAAIGGERFVPQDKAMRTLGLARLAETSLALAPPEVIAALDAYAAGVNAWIGSHGGALPLEFQLAGIRPQPWTPRDSLVWGRLMGMRLSGNWRAESLRARLMEVLEPDRVEALWPDYPDDAPVTVPAPLGKSEAGPAQGPAPQRAALPHLDLDRTLPPPAGSSSNAWAVAGSRTASGLPILAGDPHLGFRAPNLWYLARIDAPGLSLAGATLPGVPFHILGHNGAIAWTLTTTGADTEDLVIEQTDPDDPGRYLTPNGSRPFSVWTETIAVNGGELITHTVRSTRNGPVVSDLTGGIAGAGRGTEVSLRSAALEAEDRTAEAFYRLNRARNYRQFREALALYHSPVQNFAYADREGHIAFQVAGRIPIRRRGDGSMPVPGNSPTYEWAGFIPFDELPRLLDPESGTIVNANNRVAGPGYRHLIARDWDEPYRATRIVDLLVGDRRHDIGASRAMQLDTLSVAARDILPGLLAATPRTARTAKALGLLGSWDGRVARSRPEPLIFNAWLREIGKGLVSDEVAPVSAAVRRAGPLFLRRVLEEDRGWCDDRGTALRESCGMALAAALERSLESLRARFGSDPSRWRWGDAHIARFRHPTLGFTPFIRDLVNVDIPTDGDDSTLNRGTTRLFSLRRPFDHVHGATFRAIYDLADLDGSLFMQPTGQSGNPLSSHYRDLVRPWRDGEYVRMPAAPEEGIGRLRLLPAGR